MEKGELSHKVPYKPYTHNRENGEMGTPDKSWLQFLHIYYLVWKGDSDRSITISELKKEYGQKIREYGLDKYNPLYITNRSLELYKYGYLTKIKADNGSNHNLYRINDEGLERLERNDIIPPDEARKKFVPLSKLINPRVFQMVAPK